MRRCHFSMLPAGYKAKRLSSVDYTTKTIHRHHLHHQHHESVTQREMECIHSNLQQVDKKRKRHYVYEEKDKQDVPKYTAQCGTTAAIRKFNPRFPNLNESTVRPWLKKYREHLK